MGVGLDVIGTGSPGTGWARSDSVGTVGDSPTPSSTLGGGMTPMIGISIQVETYMGSLVIVTTNTSITKF